jgi:hypothetical protein
MRHYLQQLAQHINSIQRSLKSPVKIRMVKMGKRLKKKKNNNRIQINL